MAERGWWGGLLDETAKLPQGIKQLVVDAVTGQPRTDPTQPVVTPGPGSLLDLTPVPSVTEAYKASDDVSKGGYEGGKAVGTYLGGLLGIIPALGAVRKAAPIRAYHGSPHSFDRFDLSKIGTGEGAQAYGHGLYFAENEGVARSYKTAGTGPTPAALQYEGQNVVNVPMAQFEALPDLTRQALIFAKGDANIAQAVQNATAHGRSDIADEIMRLHFSGKLGQSAPSPSGHMYEVGIHADPAKMLDWDKRFTQQSPEVQKAISQTVTRARDEAAAGPFAMHGTVQGAAGTEHASPERLSDLSGAAVNQMLQRVYGGPMQSQVLKEAGIPGIKYLDQGSRTAGQGSSNYVVFDPKIIEIMRKYGIPIGAGGAAAATVPGLLTDDRVH